MDPSSSSPPLITAVEEQPQDQASAPGSGSNPTSLCGGGLHLGREPSRRCRKPPPLHSGADWKVVLHLPEIETWLRATSDRVAQLTHSVSQDAASRHVDVHLVQLKDICEDISDHVEQIHALLETEFSLKLLSYSVNIIVDIRTVQLLWHQLRVSVLVLKERMLQGLQDSNGNYTRQTDILQAFSQDQHQTRLDALTEVDDCGQLTIRCSQDYFSLDCGITAYELSDYSPGDDPEGPGPNKHTPQLQQDVDLLTTAASQQDVNEGSGQRDTTDMPSDDHSAPKEPTMQCGSSSQGEGLVTKRPLQEGNLSIGMAPTEASLPKRAAFLSDGGGTYGDMGGGTELGSLSSGLLSQTELGQSTPSLLDPLDRTKFWLELESEYPEGVSQSCENQQVMNGCNPQISPSGSREGGGGPEGSVQGSLSIKKSSSAARSPAIGPSPPHNNTSTQMETSHAETQACSEGESDSSVPSPMREQLLSSDLEASGEDSDPRPLPDKPAVWIVKRRGQKEAARVSARSSPDREHWFGSEEFLALPAQLHQTEMLAMKLESLAQTFPVVSEEPLQDVDDWELTELNPDWELGASGASENNVEESGEENPSPLMQHPHGQVFHCFSTSSSDIAPSLDESIESGPLSDLQSEDEGRRSADRTGLQLTAPPVDGRGGAILVQQLLEDIQQQDGDPDIWKKIECFVSQLDSFIVWLQSALDSTDNWTQPRHDLDSLRIYLETHLSFKLNVDSQSVLKESILEEGRALLEVITSHKSGLRDILQMVSSQWEQLQRQIRRQHGWMLLALRSIQARILDGQSHKAMLRSDNPSANQQALCPEEGSKLIITGRPPSQHRRLQQMEEVGQTGLPARVQRNPEVQTGLLARVQRNPEVQTGLPARVQRNPEVQTGLPARVQRNPEVQTGLPARVQRNPEVQTGLPARVQRNPEVQTGLPARVQRNPEVQTGFPARVQRNPEVQTGLTARVQRNPEVQTGLPARVQRKPEVQTGLPARVQRNPEVQTGLPALLQRNPEVQTGLPARVQRNPEVQTGLPARVQRNPEVQTGLTARVQRNPEVQTGLPAGVQRNPEVQTGLPAGVQRNPEVQTGLPSCVQRNPEVQTGLPARVQRNPEVQTGLTARVRNPEVQKGLPAHVQRNPEVQTGLAARVQRNPEVQTGLAARVRNPEVQTGLPARVQRNPEVQTGFPARVQRNPEVQTGLPARVQRNPEVQTGLPARVQRNPEVQTGLPAGVQRNPEVQTGLPALLQRNPEVQTGLPARVQRNPEVQTGLPARVQRNPEVQTGLTARVQRNPEVQTGLPAGVQRNPEVQTGLPARVQRNPEVQTGLPARVQRNSEVQTGLPARVQRNSEVQTGLPARVQRNSEVPPVSSANDPGEVEAHRDVLEQMVIKLTGLHYASPPRRIHYHHLSRNNSLQEFETEYQELWDWLMELDAVVTDSHQLMMSEEQRQHLYKGSAVELSLMQWRRFSLLGWAESLRRSPTTLPEDFDQKIHTLNQRWTQLEKTLGNHSGTSPSHPDSPPSSSAASRPLLAGSGGGSEDTRSALSPVTTSLLEQLETRIKELKAWLRETELLIFNSCLRNQQEVHTQLHSFKSLCMEVRGRRRAVSSVLRLCQKLLQQSHRSMMGPLAEVGSEAEQHREALQLLSVNLERRWEAIVMQAIQWQNRLKRELGERQVPKSLLDPNLMDLHQDSPVSASQAAPDDSWEWDEMDMTIAEPEQLDMTEPDLTHNLPTGLNPDSDRILPSVDQSNRISTNRIQSHEILSNRAWSDSEDQNLSVQSDQPVVTSHRPQNNNVYQVYSLHNVELYRQPQFLMEKKNVSSSPVNPKAGNRKHQILLKSLSKDSTFSSMESLPDLLGGLVLSSQGRRGGGGRRSSDSRSGRRSESESGIMSDMGDMEMTPNSEIQGEEEVQEEVRRGGESRRMDAKRVEEKRRRQRRGGGEAVEILINGHGILTPADSDSDHEADGHRPASSTFLITHSDITVFKGHQHNLETPPQLSRQSPTPLLSQGSSLESLLALSEELFPSPKDPLQRSASLESCLAMCRSTGGETGGSLASLGEPEQLEGGEKEREEMGLKKNRQKGETSSGELSRRTLELLKCLENIQTPPAMKMTRSVSDMAIRSTLPQRSWLPNSPSLGGRVTPLCGLRKGPPSLINESSATASLTELSSAEDSSLASEDIAALKNHRRLCLVPAVAALNANSCSLRKHCHGNNRGQVAEEADAASLSMVVNVSCTSACTDEDEDDSDLLSSSTLTLTEEELGIRDEGEEEEEERLSSTSSGDEDEDEEDEMEGSYVLGLEYMKRELQSWLRPPRNAFSTSSKTEAGLRDELQCGTSLSTSLPASSSLAFNTSSHNKEQTEQEKQENRRNATKSYISQFVDDMENGNVEQSSLKGKDEDDELLREESGLFTKKGESFREFYVSAKTGESVWGVNSLTRNSEPNTTKTKTLSSSTSCELLPFPATQASSLVGQLKGELPCHSSALPSPPTLSPLEDCTSQKTQRGCRPAAGGRKAITIQENFAFSSLVKEESKREVRSKESSLAPKKQHKRHSSCCSQHPSSSSSFSSFKSCNGEEGKKENVHSFVMEIIDMTSVVLRNKENQNQCEEPCQGEKNSSTTDQEPASLAQIKDKVLEHSHRPIQLRKGDFYSYLSLSSHDSDCGEVSQCSEDKTIAPEGLSSYSTSTQDLHSFSPMMSTSPKPSTSSRPSTPGPDSNKDVCSFDLGSFDRQFNVNNSLENPLEGHSSSNPTMPLSPDMRDEETLFSACTEEVYLGPPLCYSIALTKTPTSFSPKEENLGYQEPEMSDQKTGSKLDENFGYLSQELWDYQQNYSPGYLLTATESHSELEKDVRHLSGGIPTLKNEETPLISNSQGTCSISTPTSTFSSPSENFASSLDGPSTKPEYNKPPPPRFLSSGPERKKGDETPYFHWDVARGEVTDATSRNTQEEEVRSHNEGTAYLNPRVRVALIDRSASECLADTKRLESNMGAVMTKISVCTSATNPSKETGSSATHINPKINRSAMKGGDREEEECGGVVDTRGMKHEKGRRGWASTQQEAKATVAKQVRTPTISLIPYLLKLDMAQTAPSPLLSR
ncbi:A-kinase anchor protein 6 [Lampris incognitus]|uniref:A-kinase anchor protein 6 n=1 Tax=Lampris incognitus TaxID=2546036 RepID=UPI0024B491B0|nr:A-kinase anchor protein 6 [Lampris incognitus]